MNIKWLTIVFLLHLVNGLRKCPEECVCDLDEKGRFQTLCSKGGWKQIPYLNFDSEVEVIVIKGPNNYLTIGPIFQSMRKLEIIKVTDANVPAIGGRSFWGLVKLRKLDLSRNNITQIITENFRGLDDLEELELSKNRMERMSSSVFSHLKNLRSLNLSDNSIDELLSRLFHLLGKLKYLDLSRNPINDFPPEVFKDILELKVLKCRGCHLQNINPQLYNMLQHLAELDLGENQFKYLEKSEFKDLKRLKTLRLDGNQLSVVVDNLFEYQKSLNYLDLSRNRLAKIAEMAFDNLSNLTYLDVSYNKLTRIEVECLYPLTSLQTFNISGNLQMDLMEMKPSFQVVQNVTTLAVADMGPLPMGMFVPFRHLKSLNLSGNHIDNITLQIINPLSHLLVLDLSRNQLNGIEDRYARKLLKIDDVKVENNPLICDRCHMGALIDETKKLRWNVLPECFLPERLRGIPIDDLNPLTIEECMDVIVDEGHDAASTSHNFLEQGSISILAFCALLLFIIMAIIIVSSAVCYTRHRARYYTHEEKRSEAMIEKSGEQPTVTDSEINFKFPYNDRVCTIDEMCLPPPPPPPSKIAPNVERFD